MPNTRNQNNQPTTAQAVKSNSEVRERFLKVFNDAFYYDLQEETFAACIARVSGMILSDLTRQANRMDIDPPVDPHHFTEYLFHSENLLRFLAQSYELYQELSEE